MFEFIRTHRRLMQFMLMLIIVPSFALVGISGYKGFGDDPSTVAKVGGQPITQQQWEEAQRQQTERYRQMLGAQFDQKMFETPEAKQAILDNLIAERALNAEVVHGSLGISDAALQKTIIDSLPDLVLPTGKFDTERYTALLAAQGMRPTDYQERLRSSLLMEQLTGAIQLSAFAPKTVSNHLSDINEQEREVQELVLPATQFLPQVKVTDAMVKAFYDKNAKLFEIPEQVKAEYVVLDSAKVAEQLTVSDADVAAYYDKNQKRFTAAEARKVSHILITFKKDASAAEKSTAKTKAEAVLAEVRKAPANFAAIAKKESQDPASAELGGDLGLVEGDALPKALEATALKLKQGEISDLVASEFGYHILTVTSLKASAIKPLDEVKGEIVADLKKQQAQKKYSDMSGVFTDTVYDQADSLKPVADKLKLDIQTANGLSRTPSPASANTVVGNAKFLKAIFSNDALKNKRNTEAVEVAPGVLVAGRVVEFKPASKRPLAEVDALIRQQVTQEEAFKLAKKEGEAKIAALKASGETTGFAAAQMISRGKADGINRAAIMQVMKADVSKLPAYVGVDLPGMGYGLYRIGKVQQAAKPDAARRQSEKDQIANILAQQEMHDYVEVLKVKAKTKILHPVTVASTDAAADVK